MRDEGSTHIHDSDGVLIAMTYAHLRHDSASVADRIVRSTNAHGPLVAALWELLKATERKDFREERLEAARMNALETLEALAAAAGVESGGA